MTIRVLVADDQAMIRGALAGLLDLERDIEVVAQAADGAQALEKLGRLADSSGLTRANAPADVAIIDIEMPRMDGDSGDPRSFPGRAGADRDDVWTPGVPAARPRRGCHGLYGEGRTG